MGWYHKLLLTGALLAVAAGGSGLAYHVATRDPYMPMGHQRVFASEELPVYAKKRNKNTQIGTLEVADIATLLGRNSKETGTGKRKAVGAERRGNKTVYIKKDASFWYKINFNGMEGWVHADFSDPTAAWAELRRLDTLYGPEIYTRYLVEARGANEDFWLDALKGKDEVLQKQAINALGQMSSQKAIELLITLLESDRLPDTGDLSTPSIGNVYGALASIRGQETINELIQFYNRRDGQVPRAEARLSFSFYSVLAYAVTSDAEMRYVSDFFQRVAHEGEVREGYVGFFLSSRGRGLKEAMEVLERCTRKGYQNC